MGNKYKPRSKRQQNNIRDIKQYFLIITNGEHTEKKYFNGLEKNYFRK